MTELLHAVQHLLRCWLAHFVNDLAVGEEDNAISNGRRNRIVRDHHNCLPEFINCAAHELEYFCTRARVEVAGGLVGENDFRA